MTKTFQEETLPAQSCLERRTDLDFRILAIGYCLIFEIWNLNQSVKFQQSCSPQIKIKSESLCPELFT